MLVLPARLVCVTDGQHWGRRKGDSRRSRLTRSGFQDRALQLVQLRRSQCQLRHKRYCFHSPFSSVHVTFQMQHHWRRQRSCPGRQSAFIAAPTASSSRTCFSLLATAPPTSSARSPQRKRSWTSCMRSAS